MIYKSKIDPVCSKCERVQFCEWAHKMTHIQGKLKEINAIFGDTPISVKTYCKIFWEK